MRAARFLHRSNPKPDTRLRPLRPRSILGPGPVVPHPSRTLRRWPMTDPVQITDLLLQLRGGDPAAADQLYAAVYPQLRRIAHRHLQGEREGHTLGTTGLVHETYVKLVDLARVSI